MTDDNLILKCGSATRTRSFGPADYGGTAMKAVFAGLLGASLALSTPTSAKIIDTRYYMPSTMLGMCKSDIARGEAGFCTGYVIATWEQMARASEVCTPPEVKYEDMLRAVVKRIETVGGLDTRTHTEADGRAQSYLTFGRHRGQARFATGRMHALPAPGPLHRRQADRTIRPQRQHDQMGERPERRLPESRRA